MKKKTTRLTKYDELTRLYQCYYVTEVWSTSDLLRMTFLEQKATLAQVRKALALFGKSPEEEFA